MAQLRGQRFVKRTGESDVRMERRGEIAGEPSARDEKPEAEARKVERPADAGGWRRGVAAESREAAEGRHRAPGAGKAEREAWLSQRFWDGDTGSCHSGLLLGREETSTSQPGGGRPSRAPLRPQPAAESPGVRPGRGGAG